VDDEQSLYPDKPFFMYWAPGAVHGPHHIFSEWADRYKGKFDDGWDAYRERVYKRQIEMGIIPAETKLTPRDETMHSWDSIPAGQRAFQRRGMEIFAGFVEHADAQVGRLVAGLERRHLRDNTLIIYIFGDNGSSAEGQQGSISELLAQNNISSSVEQQLAALDRIGGPPALGSARTDNMYHAGWAWAGDTPFKGTKLLGSYFGGTRNPMVVSWPQRIKPDKTIRSQFHHVVDIAPKLYEILNIPHQKWCTVTTRFPSMVSASPTLPTIPPLQQRSKFSFSTTTAAVPSIRTVGSPAQSVHVRLGGSGGGVTLYMDKGQLVYEYNMMIIEQYAARSAEPLAPGKHKIEVVTDIQGPGLPGVVTLDVDGKVVGKAELTRTVPAAFTASETFDVGIDLGSPVSLNYFERRPFEFDGQIENVTVELR
jgi:hypothetical protein